MASANQGLQAPFPGLWMNDEDWTLGTLLEIVRQTAQAQLARGAELEPYGVKLLAEPARPVTFFPGQTLPGADQETLLRAILEELRAPSSDALLGVALVLALQTEAGQRLFTAQIESASYRVVALFRYWQGPDGAAIVAEPEIGGELMVREGLDWPRRP